MVTQEKPDEHQQILSSARKVLAEFLAELEAHPLASTYTTRRRINALRVLLDSL